MPPPKPDDSATKIAKYTQSISSGVANLLTELGRANTTSPADADGSRAILAQLQALTMQIEAMNTRLAAVEKSIGKPGGDAVPEPIQIDPERSITCPDLTVEEYNSLARRHNATAWGGNDALMPLRTTRNKLIVGFPTTLGHLVDLDLIVEDILKKAFGLSDERDALWTFIGANTACQRMYEYYTTGEKLAEGRMEFRFVREKEIAAAGPPTAETKRAAAAHNRIARVKNAKSTGQLMPIHDDRNIPVYGWPRTLDMLVNPYRQWSVLWQLGEHGQSVEKEGCMDRLTKFVGADEKEAAEWREGGKGEFDRYWLM